MTRKDARYPALATTVFIFVVGLFVVLAAAGTAVIRSAISNQGQTVLSEAVEARGRALQSTFMQSLSLLWGQAEGLADDLSDPAQSVDLDARLGDLTAGNSWISWAGYADLGGTITNASARELEGTSVASDTWFSQGLQGPFAGNGQRSAVLAGRDGPPSEMARFLDLAAPVRDAGRRPVGVLGVHIDIEAARKQFKQIAEALGIQAFLIRSDGDVVIASTDVSSDAVGPPSLRAARVGTGRPFVETWPDGLDYMTVVLADIGYGDLPEFGWSMVVRMPMQRLDSFEATILRSIAVAVAAGLAVTVLLTALYVYLYVRPIRRLADSAAEVAAGEDVYPFESRRTREVATLSSALGVLQSRAHRP